MALLTLAAILTTASPAAAAVNDSFSVSTTSGGCGATDFVDHGPDAAGGGNNDDYLTHAGGTNVIGGDLITIQACLVDGANDTTPFNCDDRSNFSADG